MAVGDYTVDAVQVKAFDAAGNAAVTKNDASISILSTDLMSTPIMLDMNGDGIHTSALSAGMKFDINADGNQETIGWSDGKDALLVHDINHDGQINDGSELFGSATTLSDGSMAKDGYEALRDLDSNKDNVIDSQDTAYNELKLWIDANQDGKVDDGEMMSLKDAGVESMNLMTKNDVSTDNGNIIGLESSFTTTSGETHNMADVWFATSEVSNSQPQTVLVEDTNTDMTQIATPNEDIQFDGLESMVADVSVDKIGYTDLSNVPLNSIFTLDQDPDVSLFKEDIVASSNIPVQTTSAEIISTVEQPELYIDNNISMMIEIDPNPQDMGV